MSSKMYLSKPMRNALDDLPIRQETFFAYKNSNEVCWCGVSDQIYKTQTLVALVKRGLIQYINEDRTRKDHLNGIPHFVEKTEEHDTPEFQKQNEIWLK